MVNDDGIRYDTVMDEWTGKISLVPYHVTDISPDGRSRGEIDEEKGTVTARFRRPIVR